jgi:hypothetical protein
MIFEWVLMGALLAKLLTVLCAELVCTFRAFERGIGILPESFRKNKHAQLPYRKCDHRHCKKRNGVEADDKHHRCKHHKVIPVKNATGGAAFILDNKTEGTPYKYTDKVAYIEKHADQKENSLINDFCKIKGSNDSKE